MDVIIKDVPDSCDEDCVKQMAAVAVERFLLKPLQPGKADLDKFQSDMDTFLDVNGLDKKFDKVVKEEKEEGKV